MRRLLVLVLLLSSSCSSSAPQLQIGVRRTAVDLAFQDEKLPPLPPEVRTVLLELPSPPLPALFEAPPKLPPLKLPDLCPKADKNAVPEDPVSTRITKPPVAGRYLYLTSGSVKITLPPPLPTITLPVLIPLTPEVKNITRVPLTDPTGAQTEVATQYDVVLTVGTVTTTETFQVRLDGLYLLKRKIATGATTISFAPVPPVLLYEYGAESHTWNVAGADPDTRLAAVVQGRILGRTIVDVCGTVVDSYKVGTSEMITAADGSYQSQTERFPDCPSQAGDSCGARYNVRNFATHITPIPVRQEFNYTDHVVVATPQGAGAAVIEWHYTMTLASLKPVKI